MKPSINYTGSSTLMVDGVERPAPQCWALPFSGLSSRKPLKVGRRVMELPVETYCGGQAQGRFVRRPVLEPSHPQAAFVFLTLFLFFSSRICKRQRPQSINFSLCALPIVRVSVFLMMALCRPGILFDGISGFDSKGLFTFLDSGPEVKRYFTNSLLGKPSSPGSCSWGLKVGTLTFSQVPPALRWENCQNGTGWKLG